MHSPFTLHKRRSKRFGAVYYMQARDESGRRLSALSTGETSKAAAQTWAVEYLRRGGSRQNQTFAQYAEERHWWEWGACLYCQGKVARDQSISRNYADVRTSYLKNHVLPEIGDVKLCKISPDLLERWQMRLLSEGRNSATVNRVLGTVRIMLNEAVRLGFIGANPSSKVRDLHEKPKARGILALEEMAALFNEERIAEVWGGNIPMLSASAGLREGEVRALQLQDVHETSVSVVHSFGKYGLTHPKWGSSREIPVPIKTRRYLGDVIRQLEYQEPEDWVFAGRTQAEP
ncbi:MAG: hypothetical protein IMZ69_08000, partial [Spirochaetes bacterium]|nr:hypothetical protein [Spirochaetota bacterium]